MNVQGWKPGLSSGDLPTCKPGIALILGPPAIGPTGGIRRLVVGIQRACFRPYAMLHGWYALPGAPG